MIPPPYSADVINDFMDAMREQGIEPPEHIIGDGKKHRFPTNGRRSDDAGWYVFHLDDAPAGIFGDYRRGDDFEVTWYARENALNPAERDAQRQRIVELQRQRTTERQVMHAQAAERAAAIWETTTEAIRHPYLKTKGVQSHGLRIGADGRLLVPVRSIGGKFMSLQAIAADGVKRFMTGARKRGGMFTIGELGDPILVAEGYATAASIHEATDRGVVVAFDAGNLAPVASALRKRHADAQIVIAADDDCDTEGNPGVSKATAAAAAVGGVVAVPDFGPDRPEGVTDFNDLAQLRGAAAVRENIERAIEGASAVGTSAAPEVSPVGTTEDEIALTLAEQHCDELRWCEEAGCWYRWTGARWDPDRLLAVYDIARKLCRAAARTASAGEAKVLRKAATVAAVERLARSDRRVAASLDQWDRENWLLNTPAGIVDLPTGAIIGHEATRFMTKITRGAPVADWRAATPRWMQFLDELTTADQGIGKYLQRIAGYACTGSVREHVLPFLLGPGGNGKGTFIETLAYVLGDYASPLPEGFLAERRGETHPTELADLAGARFVYCSETTAGSAWNESRLKALTGGDRIKARHMRQDFTAFDPTHTLVVVGNNAPRIRSVDDAIKRRIQVVPLHFRPRRPDLELPDRLRREADGIMGWAIEGARAWIEGGLQPPHAILDASAGYFDSQDDIGQWIDSACEVEPAKAASPTKLYLSFKAFAEANGMALLGRKSLGNELEKRGFARGKDSYSNRIHHGIAVRPDVSDVSSFIDR